MRRTGWVAAVVVVVLAGVAGGPPAAAQSLLPGVPVGKCGTLTMDPYETQNFPPFVGSSDLNAQTANGRLAAGLTRQGTITVLRWPTPSSYDQVKHFSPDANLPRAGALPNEGIFLGVVVDGRTRWLRDWPVRQRFTSTRSDEVENVFTERGLGLEVRVRSVVASATDVLAQRVTVRRLHAGAARPSGLIAFENLNLVVSNLPSAFLADWCTEELNTDRARWDAGADAIVHEKQGIDAATGKRQSVALAMGWRDGTDGFQVGGDAHEPTALGAGRALDALEDAADGRLSGNPTFTGQTTGAVSAALRFRGRVAERELLLAGGHTAAAATRVLAGARTAGQARLAQDKQRALVRQLGAAPMPKVDDPRSQAIARRTLILLVTSMADTGAIVASIATQPPYAEDWPRDGAFFDEALDAAGLHELVTRHKRFYMRTQATATSSPPGAIGVPPGNWGMNYYENGTVATPIPYEIDETGFALWGFWRHFEHTRDRAYLEEAYPAIRRGAEWFLVCRDPLNGLQCHATEDDDITGPKQTIVGAATVRIGLWAAERAARELRRTADATRFAARRAELERAIDAQLWDEACGCWQEGDQPGKFLSYALWPVPLKDFADARFGRHAERVWNAFAPSFDAPRGDRRWYTYEGIGLNALAGFYAERHPDRLARLRRGLEWIAREVATPDTVILGENWRVKDGEVETMTAMPQIWEHVLFYLSALKVYGAR